MSGDEAEQGPFDIDTNVPNAARVYDYLLGGTDNFAVDREVAERNNAVLPGGIGAAKAEVRANRDFLVRAVRHLADDLGVRQFLDIGTGVPNGDNVHAVALDAAPDSRIVCVDYDPVVLAHAHGLLRGGDVEGATAFVHGDLREPDKILDEARRTLDFDRPVALLLLGILYLIPDHDDPHAIAARLLDALPSGSYLVVSHMTGDFNPEMIELAERLNETMSEPLILRDRDAVARFFDGLDLVSPGVVQVGDWYQGEPPPDDADRRVTAYYVGMARKP